MSEIKELPEKNSILLVFDDGDRNYNFVNAAVSRNGDISELNMITHTGFSSDSVLIYDGEDIGAGEIDIRYFTAASRGGERIEFYNAGKTPLKFLTPAGLIEISPDVQAIVS